jgi:hypothetical protein
VVAVLLASLVLGARVPGLAATDLFVAGIDDIPLMPGLQPVADTGVVFDTAAGRIVESFAAGPVERSDVLTFYAASLPQLGWEPEQIGDAAMTYRREAEVLRVRLFGGVPVLTVQFSLAPAEAE